MKTLHHAVIGSCLALAVFGALAQDTMKKDDMTKPTLDECKEYMSMRKKEGEKPDPSMKKKDQMCTAMVKKDHAGMKDSMKK